MWWRCFVDLLFPRLCKVCGRELLQGEHHLCLHCLSDMPFTYYWNWEENPAEKKLWGRTYLNMVAPLFFYSRESPYAKLLVRIKYQGDTALAQFLGYLLGEKLREASRKHEFDCLVPVPLHPRKKWKRGYNQSEEVAKGIAKALWGDSAIAKGTADKNLRSRIVTGCLRRRRYTKTQTRISVGNKWENMHDAFEVRHPELLEGKHILLIDDVLTTGATVDACYQALSTIPGIKVSVATLAYVDN